jgi:anti-sigma B factor antagonist
VFCVFSRETSWDAAGRIVAFSGDLDYTVTSAVEVLLDKMLAPDRSVVLDVSGVEFADSSGLRLLVWAAQESQERGVRLSLSAPGELLALLLSTSGVSELFDTYSTAEAALAASDPCARVG